VITSSRLSNSKQGLASTLAPFTSRRYLDRIEKAFDKQITELKNEIAVLDQEIYDNKKAITILQEELS
jgi:uncharacterized protein YaaN involved in tellurite resistance